MIFRPGWRPKPVKFIDFNFNQFSGSTHLHEPAFGSLSQQAANEGLGFEARPNFYFAAEHVDAEPYHQASILAFCKRESRCATKKVFQL